MLLGLKIKKLRELKNLTQTHIAEQLGVSQSAYSKIELGESEVTFSKLEKISETLGMKPEEVIAFNESRMFNLIQSKEKEFGDINNSMIENERKLYQDQINLLKEEVAYLKQLLEKVLN